MGILGTTSARYILPVTYKYLLNHSTSSIVIKFLQNYLIEMKVHDQGDTHGWNGLFSYSFLQTGSYAGERIPFFMSSGLFSVHVEPGQSAIILTPDKFIWNGS